MRMASPRRMCGSAWTTGLAPSVNLGAPALGMYTQPSKQDRGASR